MGHLSIGPGGRVGHGFDAVLATADELTPAERLELATEAIRQWQAWATAVPRPAEGDGAAAAADHPRQWPPVWLNLARQRAREHGRAYFTRDEVAVLYASGAITACGWTLVRTDIHDFVVTSGNTGGWPEKIGNCAGAVLLDLPNGPALAIFDSLSDG
jgi:hypothetical protein